MEMTLLSKKNSGYASRFFFVFFFVFCFFFQKMISSNCGIYLFFILKISWHLDMFVETGDLNGFNSYPIHPKGFRLSKKALHKQNYFLKLRKSCRSYQHFIFTFFDFSFYCYTISCSPLCGINVPLKYRIHYHHFWFLQS